MTVECRTAEDVRRLARSVYKVPSTPVVRLLPTPKRAVKKFVPPDFMSYSGVVFGSFPEPPIVVPVELPPTRRILVSQIIEACAGHYGLDLGDMYSARRHAAFVRARHVAMYLAMMLTFKTLSDIGRLMGGRDHTTVIHGVGKIKKLLPIDPELAEAINSIRARLGVAG